MATRRWPCRVALSCPLRAVGLIDIARAAPDIGGRGAIASAVGSIATGAFARGGRVGSGLRTGAATGAVVVLARHGACPRSWRTVATIQVGPLGAGGSAALVAAGGRTPVL